MLRIATLLAALAGSLSAPQASVAVHASRYGPVLFDQRGHVLYLFTRERGSTPACYGACAAAWPPYLAKGPVHGRFVATTARRDGTRQVTYKGRPLYYYVGDRRPGQILCQGVVEFGGTWLVVKRTGRPVV